MGREIFSMWISIQSNMKSNMQSLFNGRLMTNDDRSLYVRHALQCVIIMNNHMMLIIHVECDYQPNPTWNPICKAFLTEGLWPMQCVIIMNNPYDVNNRCGVSSIMLIMHVECEYQLNPTWNPICKAFLMEGLWSMIIGDSMLGTHCNV